MEKFVEQQLSFRDVFRKLDSDNDGTLSREEFIVNLTNMDVNRSNLTAQLGIPNIDLTNPTAARSILGDVFDSIDHDRSGLVTINELHAYMQNCLNSNAPVRNHELDMKGDEDLRNEKTMRNEKALKKEKSGKLDSPQPQVIELRHVGTKEVNIPQDGELPRQVLTEDMPVRLINIPRCLR
eukprot:gnl/TRDRNA2_/TRDRNA2_130643_c1_seq3.p1 gnl/TRDRNA2_/TRDRNA2_130643_c1~~gnl/TRDRNA2_/TRDRNA2_130643_c1_seq3.p1  ORF type:complete len:181 (+),score=37.06 gnl/TRDRNA2_/TRDRNA2_130643_c1_seq3:132-674(+)